MLHLPPETLYQIRREYHQQLLNQALMLYQIRQPKDPVMNLLHYLFVACLGLLLALCFSGQAQAATNTIPIVGGGSYGEAVSINPNVEYSGAVSPSHDKDIFFVDVGHGEMVTFVFTSSVTFGSAFFQLYDQNHATALESKFVTGAEQTYQLQHMGNSSTPTRYYFVVDANANINQYNFHFTLRPQLDGGSSGDAGDDGANARLVTPTLGGSVSFTGTVGYADKIDFFAISAVSGLAISVTVTVLDYGEDLRFYQSLYDQSGSTLLLPTAFLDKPSKEATILRHMANNTTPSAYLLKMEGNGKKGNPLQYQVVVEAVQQRDGEEGGDAGDNFDSARLIKPDLVAPNNRLGSADSEDYYRIDLPIDPNVPELVETPYFMLIAPVSWPQGTGGSLTLQLYQANRSPLGSAVSIQAPVSDAAVIDLTRCDLCYVKVSDNSTNTEQLAYTFTLSAAKRLYLPFVAR